MTTERLIVNNRVFLLGLDELYREAMKRHERAELLRFARETAKTLGVSPANVPIEGYYSEEESLTEYFRLVRALQRVPKGRESDVKHLFGFRRLRQVTGSPIFGPAVDGDFLLSVGADPLTVALEKTFPEWTVGNLTKEAYACAKDSSDFSLVALAALARDAVVLAALRESVVLYVSDVCGAAMSDEPEFVYIWEVDELLQTRAASFVDTFNNLFGESLPRPAPENAEKFFAASGESDIVGRCVRIGSDDSAMPVRQYHWAVDWDAKHGTVVNEFWDDEIWTTERYRSEREATGRRG